MTFGMALEVLKDGGRVRRKSWIHKDYLVLKEVKVKRETVRRFYRIPTNAEFADCLLDIDYEWLLAEDWEEVRG